MNRLITRATPSTSGRARKQFLISSTPKSKPLIPGLLLLCCVGACATDWPQLRGPTMDGSSPDPISTNWPANGPTVVWTNMSLMNGFSSFAVSQGRAFTLIAKWDDRREYCVAVNAATGANIWAKPVGDMWSEWDPTSGNDNTGGAGASFYDTGNGSHTTPSVHNGRVIVLSLGRESPPQLNLVCLNATNGSVIWSKDLVALYGATTVPYGEGNGASPCLDNDLVFVNLNSSSDSRNLAAFRVANGSVAWRSEDEQATHATPVVATIDGVRQVIFATRTGLVSLNSTNGTFLWKFTSWPFWPIEGLVIMGASPVVYSNIVYCTAGWGRGAVAARVTLNNGTWTVQELYFMQGANYKSLWMTPVCFQGHVYSLCGDGATPFLNGPLNCIELSTGILKWSTGTFGMGGLILVNTNLLVLTETGELVLVQPNPTEYVELARYQAFQFDYSAHGKCWNSPAFSDGRIYARSTRGGICLDVSVPVPPAPPPLKLLSPHFLNSTQLQLVVSTANGTPIDSNRLPKIEVRATNTPAASVSNWPRLTNPLVLAPDGLARLTNTISPGQPRQFYRAAEQP